MPRPAAALAVLAALALLPALPAALRATSDESQIYLTWRAPYGTPRALTDLAVTAGDTTLEDTLYLTCDLGTDSPKLNAMTGTLRVHAQVGDTLAPYWQLGHATEEPLRVRVLWEADSARGVRWPWNGLPGAGAIHYDFDRGGGELRIIYAVPSTMARPIAYGDRFVLARLAFRRPASRADTRHPVCIEWAKATLGLGEGFEPEVTRGERFVSWNARGARVCEEFRGPLKPRAWKPR